MPRTFGQGLAFVIGFAIALALSPFGAKGDPGDAQAAGLEARFHQMVNEYRVGRQLIPMARDAALDAVARAHSQDMARRRYLAHVNPEGQDPLDRIEAAGIDGFTLAAENAGLTDRSDPNREILEGWIASPIHRNNLHAPPFNRTGIGIARSRDGTWYITQLYITVPN
ncbi:MAG: CAP domain-containing protein [Myxococcota bacterium]|nr:CAP domain-containing protein [Myxococcota bacterium]